MRLQRNSHRSQFIKEVKERWPELNGEINEENGLLHLEISVLTRFAQRMIDEGEAEMLSEIFELAERFERTGNRALQNALDVSFVEDLLFENSKKNYRSWAWKLMPASLKELYVEFHGKPGA